jgi:hypothetical protein
MVLSLGIEGSQGSNPVYVALVYKEYLQLVLIIFYLDRVEDQQPISFVVSPIMKNINVKNKCQQST